MDKNQNNNEKKGFAASFNNKYFRIGGYSTLVAFIVIAVAIVINLIVARLPSTFTKFDTSDTQLYTLSDQTKEIVKAMTDDITIYMIAQSGAEDGTISELVDRYAALNSGIKVKKIDPVVNPSFTAAYNAEGIGENSLIIETAKRFKIVEYGDIFVTSYSMDANYQMKTTTSFAGESAITSALDYVTSDSVAKIYVLTGHGEASLSAAMTKYIEDDNIDLEQISLLTTPEIPADATALLINAPTADITSTEADAILAYMKSGGAVVMLTAYTQDGKNFPNLYGIGEYYGIEAHNGLVNEGSTNHFMQAPYFILPKTADHEIMTTLENANFMNIVPQAMGLVKADTMPRTTVNVTPVLYTTASAYLKTGSFETVEKADGDMQAEFGLLMTATENKTKLVWYASPFFIDDSIDQIVSGGNSNVFLSSLSWITGKEASVSIAAKSMQVAALVLTETESNLWSAVTTVIIPLAIAGFGLYVWMKRRKR